MNKKRPFYKNGLLIGLLLTVGGFLLVGFTKTNISVIIFLVGVIVFAVSLVRWIVKKIKGTMSKSRTQQTNAPAPVKSYTQPENHTPAPITIPTESPVPTSMKVPEPTPEESAPQASNVRRKTETHKVTGVSHYREAIEKIGIPNSDYDMTLGELREAFDYGTRVYEYLFVPTATLEPEPDNEYDSNAIRVIVDGEHVGYIKKGSCSHVKKLIEKGWIKKIDAVVGGGKYKCLDNYGEGIEDEDFEMDETNYFVTLTLHVEETDATEQ